MTTPPLLPEAGDVIGAAKDRLVAVRPSAAPHVEKGRWGDLFIGWRGQMSVASRRLVEEIKAKRLPLAEGRALTETAASDYETQRQSEHLKSLGEAVLARKVVHSAAAGEPVTAADGTDQTSVIALNSALVAAMEVHRVSQYDNFFGLGAHRNADLVNFLSEISTTAITGMVAIVNANKAKWNDHLASTFFHKDADTLNVVTTPDAFAAIEPGGIDLFADATPASQQSVLKVVSALKAAFNKHIALTSPAGTIRRGDKFAVQAAPSASPPVKGAQYVVLQDTPILTGVQSVTVRVESAQAGIDGNLPAWVSGAGPTLALSALQPFFDSSNVLRLTTTALRAAGGSLGQGDEILRRAARASATGRHGPTVGALVAGALRGSGAARVVVLEDMTVGRSVVYVVDEAWAQSDAWLASIKQMLQDPEDGWLGTGCRLAMGVVKNQIARPELTVVLRSSKYLADTTELTGKIQATLKEYFDERPDWYTWRLAAIRAVCSRFDRRRVLACTAAAVRDAAGVPLPEPAAPVPGAELVHIALSSAPVTINFTAPT